MSSSKTAGFTGSSVRFKRPEGSFTFSAKKLSLLANPSFMMKKNRLIFYAVFGVLHLFIFLFSLYMDSQKENFQFLIQLQGKIWMLKYGSLLLLILFTTNIILHYRDNRRNRAEKEQLTSELNTLKARLYDLTEAAKPSGTANPQK
jgi:hypothetical protein